MIAVLALVALVSGQLDVSHRKVVASDGAAVALYRYSPPGRGEGQRPVLLIADLGFGRQLFDLDGRGLARALAARGRTVYVAELRGQGAAAPGPDGELSDLVLRDFPAIARAIPEPTFDLVAHGWAGTLALAAVPVELAGRVGRVAAVATPADADVPSVLVEKVLHAGGALSSLAQDPQGRAALEQLFAVRSTIPPRELSTQLALLGDLGPRRARSLLGWMHRHDLPLGPGDSVRGRLARLDRPTLLVLGLADGWASPELAAPLRELAPGAGVKLLSLSAAELAAEDYGHLSLLRGAKAPREVWAPIVDFLSEPLP